MHKKIIGDFEERTDGSTEQVAGAKLRLVARGQTGRQDVSASMKAWPELASISARRCSAFFAEAAVLVLVFGVLDFFMQKGHIEGGWVAGALVISVGLLTASVATEFSARRWLGAHP